MSDLTQQPTNNVKMSNVAEKEIASSPNDQLIKSANFNKSSNGQNAQNAQKGQIDYTLVVVPNENICKSAVMKDESELEEVNVRQNDQEDFIAKSLFRLKHGYKREECALLTKNNENSLNAVQELRLIHYPQTNNFMTLVEQLRSMREAALALQLEDVAAPLIVATEKCERVFKYHSKFDMVLESEPTQHEAVKALYELATACYNDTTELIQDWTLVYHILQELIQRIQSITTAATIANGANGKSPKTRKSLFSKKSTEEVLPEIPLEAITHQKDVCINWASQMKAFEQLTRAYRAFADRSTSFALIQEIEGIGKFCGDSIRVTFEKSQAEFLNARQLCQLHYQIDYTNFNRTLPKLNALTTAEERKAQPPRPLFSRELIGHRQLIRTGKLLEFVSPISASSSNNKKKNAAPAQPREYHLIVASDMIYLCEVANATEDQENSNTKGSKKSTQKNLPKSQLRLLHEPVLVIDSQISSTPDVVHPPLVQKNMVMVCFYNQTSYILQAESSEERDEWVECARQLNIEQPKPTDACREQDENDEIRRSTSTTSLSTVGKGKGRVSLLKRLKTLRRSSINLTEESIPEIDPDQITRTDEEEMARRMQLGQPSNWEVRRLPLDLGVIPPLEHPIPFRKSHLYDSNVRIVDLTTGKVAPGEFGMGIEDRAAYFRDDSALFAVLRPARLIPFNEIDRQRDDFFLCCKRLYKGEVMYVEPPYITDFYARSWLHPDMHIEFDAENKSVVIAKMYRIICSTSEIVSEFQKYYVWLMKTARISPDNTFLCMDYRSQPLRISKRIEKAAGATSPVETKFLEAGRKYTELGECNIEFRRMSNAPDALSVGFYNPATKRDMAIGVMVFDKCKVKATASSLGLDALNALGPSNGVIRVSHTEMSLTLWQTDARTRPTFVKGQRVFETVKSKSLDMFKITGQREALDELEEFMRVKNGTDCKARDIQETYKLIRIAFQDDVLDATEDDEYVDQDMTGKILVQNNSPNTDVKKLDSSNREESMRNNEEEMFERGVINSDSMGDVLFGHRADGHLETVIEEEEGDDNVMTKSTMTFRPKSRNALLLMEKHQQELAAADARSNKELNLTLPQIESSTFEEFVGITEYNEIGEFEAPSVANLTEFWAKTTCAVALVRSPSSTLSIEETTTDESHQSCPASPVEAISTIDPTSELEARVNAVKANGRYGNATEIIEPEVNANGVIQATRYPLKKVPVSDGAVLEDSNDDYEPGVDMEHHMPVKDLKKRWEEIYRLGI
ncbi:hypothetical protein BGZ76_011132 [Entomortierella beljakovae]|nr:hypothetical protein BGZ76_011132 [Entomortierella beljakovae]